MWWVFVHHKGKRKSVKVGSKTKALKVAREIESEIALGKLNIREKDSMPSFGEYAKKWLKGYVSVNLKDSTIRGYELMLEKHILPVLGKKRLDEIKREDVKELAFRKMKEGLSGRTTKYIITTISTIFNHAIEDGIVDYNPAQKPGKFIKARPRTEKISFLTPEEVTLLLETARTNYPRFYPLLLTALRTGMRMGELIGLMWDDVDFNGKFIEVRRSWDSTHGKFTTPKSGKVRRVDMSDHLIQTLKGWKKILAEQMMKKGIRTELVFPSDNGTPLDGRNIRRWLDLTLKKAGLRKIRFHDLRHTYASLLLNLGESPAYVQEQLGHHSIQITVDTYGHLIQGRNREAVNKLDKLDKSAPYTHPEEKNRPEFLLRPVDNPEKSKI